MAKQMIRRLSDKEPAAIQFADQVALNVSHGLLLANSLIDAGIVMSRVLLDFLGIYLNRNQQVAKRQEHPTKGDDLRIIDIGGALIEVDDVRIGENGAPVQNLFDGVEHLLYLSNRTISHLTHIVSTNKFDRKKAEIGFEQVLQLINRHVYSKLASSPVRFDTLKQSRFAVFSDQS